MKLLTALLLLLMPTYAYALTDDELVVSCKRAGSAKLIAQADAWGCELPEKLEVTGVDNRQWNPSKYVWFEARVRGCRNEHTTAQAMVQYYDGTCF